MERETLLRELESLGHYESGVNINLEHISQPMRPNKNTNTWIPDGSQKPLSYLISWFLR